MIQIIAKIIDFIILLTLFIVLIHTIRYFKLAYQSQTLINNRILRLIVSLFISLFHGISVIFGAPYIKDKQN